MTRRRRLRYHDLNFNIALVWSMRLVNMPTDESLQDIMRIRTRTTRTKFHRRASRNGQGGETLEAEKRQCVALNAEPDVYLQVLMALCGFSTGTLVRLSLGDVFASIVCFFS